MKVFLIVALAALLGSSCHAQSKGGTEEVIHLLRNAINLLSGSSEKTLEGHITALSNELKQQGLNFEAGLDNLKETLINSSGIDECCDGSAQCSEFAECIDTVFSYKCRCIDGYIGDGFQCTERPCGDTSNSLSIQHVGCLKFINIKMTWEESRLHCQSLGMKLAEDIPRVHYSTIWNAFKQYKPPEWWGIWMWVGGKGRTWESSGKSIARDLYKNGQPEGALTLCIDLSIRGSDDYNNEGLYDDGCHGAYYPLCQVPLAK